MNHAKLVAEIGINHNGDMKIVKHLIEEAAGAGFDYVKFQTRNVDACVPKERRNEMKSTPWGDMTYLDYKKKLEDIDYDMIDTWCIANEIGWYSSPWDVESVRFLEPYNMPYIKVASAGNTDLGLLEAVKDLDVPIILSTGMTTQDQFDKTWGIVGDKVDYILACTSTYPTPNSEMNLKHIQTLRDEYWSCKIGFSNHNPGILFAAASVLYGAEMVEVHVTLDRSMFGSDQAASIEPAGMRKLVKYVRAFEDGIGDGRWHVWESEKPVIKNLRWKDFV